MFESLCLTDLWLLNSLLEGCQRHFSIKILLLLLMLLLLLLAVWTSCLFGVWVFTPSWTRIICYLGIAAVKSQCQVLRQLRWMWDKWLLDVRTEGTVNVLGPWKDWLMLRRIGFFQNFPLILFIKCQNCLLPAALGWTKTTLQISTYITVQTVKKHTANPHVSSIIDVCLWVFCKFIQRKIALSVFRPFAMILEQGNGPWAPLGCFWPWLESICLITLYKVSAENTVKNQTRRSTELPTEPSGWYEGAEMGSAPAQEPLWFWDRRRLESPGQKLSNLWDTWEGEGSWLEMRPRSQCPLKALCCWGVGDTGPCSGTLQRKTRSKVLWTSDCDEGSPLSKTMTLSVQPGAAWV